MKVKLEPSLSYFLTALDNKLECLTLSYCYKLASYVDCPSKNL
jgi:hypothetical protein